MRERGGAFKCPLFYLKDAYNDQDYVETTTMSLKVKFFGSLNPLKTSFSGKGPKFFDPVEREINTWFMTHPNIDVVEIKQSTAGGSFAAEKLIVSVWYRDNEGS